MKMKQQLDLFEQKSCLNNGKYGTSCDYMKHFQSGGGTTSPEYSYIYCTYKKSGQRVKVIPRLANMHDIKIERVELPDKCVLRTENKNSGLKNIKPNYVKR